MKKSFKSALIVLLIILYSTTAMVVAEPDIIGISNITDGALISGAFEIKGVILNDGSVSKVMIKVGLDAPWEALNGVAHWNYRINTRQIIKGFERRYVTELNKMVTTYRTGTHYGDLPIQVGAFTVNGKEISRKLINVKVIPEKPYSDVVSGVYGRAFNLELKAAPEVGIYYTTDGADPKTSGGRSYTDPIPINQATKVRAVAKSSTGQYSEEAEFNFTISPTSPPTFRIQYYQDQALTRPIAGNYLKAGTYYLKIVSNRKFSSGPFITIDAPGFNNDVNLGNPVAVNDFVHRYTRVVQNDYEATGEVQEIIKISGVDDQGISVPATIPVNSAANAAYLDTHPPTTGSIILTGNLTATNDPTPELTINSNGAAQMRLALIESELAFATWVDYAADYDDFEIAAGGNGSKIVWIEFKDRAGNIQTQHASTAFTYDNSICAFDIEYYADSDLACSLGNNPYLKAGTYCLKVTANQDLDSPPVIQIDSEGSANDILTGTQTTGLTPRIFYCARTIVTDQAAVGAVRETIKIAGVEPTNKALKAAYTDTIVPAVPAVTVSPTAENLKPAWTWSSVAGASRYRYSFTNGPVWIETTQTGFIPEDNLVLDQTYTLYVQAGDKAGNWSASGKGTIRITAPDISLFQGETAIAAGSGSYDFGDAYITSTRDVTFTIRNSGNADLTLDSLRIDGEDGDESFRVITQPAATVPAGGSTTFTIRFNPVSIGSKTATVSITNNDSDESPYTFLINGTGLPAEPVIIVKQGTTEITGGSNYHFEDTLVTLSREVQFTVYNTGNADLVLSAPEISGADAASFSVSTLTSTLVAPGGSSTFKVKFTPTSGVAKSAMVSLANNDSDRNPYTFNITGTGLKPIIHVKQGTTDIAAGGSYNVGNEIVGSSRDISFTILNDGNTELTLTLPQIEGAGVFSLLTPPATKVAAGGSTTFVIRFTPTEQVTKSATISISNNDSNLSPFTFQITGTGTIVLEPAILVLQNSTDILPGSSYNFGEEFVGSGKDVVFSIQNNGTSALTLTGLPAIKIGGTDAAAFSILAQPSATIAAGGSTTFTLRFAPNSSGSKTATVEILSNDADKSPYQFTITGAGLEPPVISVYQGAIEIPALGSYTFESVNIINESSSVTFTIKNTGGGDLNLSGVPIVSSDSALFTVTEQPAATVKPGESTTFTVKFAPDSVGLKTATISIINNDADRTPYQFTLKGTGLYPSIQVSQSQNGVVITNGGSFTFNNGNEVQILSFSETYFTIVNSGSGSLKLNGATTVAISGADAACFQVLSQPDLTVAAGEETAFMIRFTPDGIVGKKTATVTIANNTTNNNPYTFTITGYGYARTVNIGSGLASYSIDTPGTFKTFILNTVPGKKYQISWQDALNQPSTQYDCKVKVTAYHGDLTNTYFSEMYSGYTWPQQIEAQDNVVYIKVAGYDGTAKGSFGLRADLFKPIMSIRRDLTPIANNGSYDLGNVSILTSGSVTFTIRNSGVASLSLSGSPKVAITEPEGRSCFKVTTEPASPVDPPRGNTYFDQTFTISFTPDGTGVRTATVSIANNDPDNNPYTFTVTGTGTGNITTLNVGTGSDAAWTQGTITSTATTKIYSFSATPNEKYTIAWDDYSDGTGNYGCDVKVSAYMKDLKTAYFTDVDKGYTSPRTITANDDTVYIKVTGSVSSGFEYFRIRAVRNVPVLNVKQGNSIIYNGGSHSFGNVSVISNKAATFTIQNTGIANLNLTNTPKVTVEGTDAACFSVTTQPASPVTPGGTTTFVVTFTPNGSGAKTATLKIANDSDVTPFSFTVNGTGEAVTPKPISLETWYEDSTELLTEVNVYAVNITPGSRYRVQWNDASDGTELYRDIYDGLDILVTAYRADMATPYSTLTEISDGYTNPAVLTAQDSIVYLKVCSAWDPMYQKEEGYYHYALRVYWEDAIMELAQGTTDISNNFGSYDFGAVVYQADAVAREFTIKNTGTATLEMGAPGGFAVQISGKDSDCFKVTTQPPNKISAGNTGNFTITFDPTTPGQKSATVSIINSDADRNPYTFTITGSCIRPIVTVKQGETVIAPGTAIYNYQDIPAYTSSNATFTIQNTGDSYLHLTGNPLIRLSGTDAASFQVITEPQASIQPGGSTTFTIRFNPVSTGVKTAIVGIYNDDHYCEFGINGNATAEQITDLTPDTWVTGSSSEAGAIKYFRFPAEYGKSYAIFWDDAVEGSGSYTGDIQVEAVTADVTKAYSTYVDSGYRNPLIITAREEAVYVRVTAKTPGTFALKYSEALPDIRVVRDAMDVWSYECGFVQIGESVYPGFEVWNIGESDLHLTGSPTAKKIGDLNENNFRISTYPSATIRPNEHSGLVVVFQPQSYGEKTASISIPNDDPDESDYSIGLRGFAVEEVNVIEKGVWIDGNISANGYTVVYKVATTVGRTYSIDWREIAAPYTGNIKLSVYRPDARDSEAYFLNKSLYLDSPPTITAQDNFIWIKVEGESYSSVGTFAVIVTEN